MPFAAADSAAARVAATRSPRSLFLARVRAAQEHIAAGDIYQANLSRRWRLELRDRENAAPGVRGIAPRESGAVRRQRAAARHDHLLVIARAADAHRRIATFRRGPSPARARATARREQDRRDTAELVAHPKERAEHIMLIDLERNDLGRVCEAGSVIGGRVHGHRVLCTRASHRLQRARAAARRMRSPVDALRALFPGGTITGCPKVRCMQIIAALEGEGRGAYTGSLGWLGTDGDADFNILIRTLTLRGDHDRAARGRRHRRRFGSRTGARRDARQGARPVARISALARDERSARHAGSTAYPAMRCRPTIADCTTATGCSRPSRVRAGIARFLEAHLARLVARAARGSRFRSRRWPRCARRSPRHAHRRRRWPLLKIIVTRGSASRRGYAPQGTESARRLLSLWPGTPPPISPAGVDLRVATLAARRTIPRSPASNI